VGQFSISANTGASARFKESCARLGIEVGPTGLAAESHGTRSSYRVRYLDQQYALTMHVKGSDARDPRVGFRLYFAWVEEPSSAGFLLVGSFPTHLDNRLS